MPCTFSHPAAVLPLRRFCPRPLDFTALVIGSLTPDLGYYAHTFALATFAHTPAGTLIVCLPSGIVLYLLFLCVREPVCHILPSRHKQALLPLCGKVPPFLPYRCLSVSISILIGAWTHILWDSFTHPTGWFVQRIAWLRDPLPEVGGTVCGYYILQQLSTITGAGIIAFTYWKWIKTHRPGPGTAPCDGRSICSGPGSPQSPSPFQSRPRSRHPDFFPAIPPFAYSCFAQEFILSRYSFPWSCLPHLPLISGASRPHELSNVRQSTQRRLN